ncbi:uncharacterized protein LOC121258125 [Juglans microcarpa x Juglans regia]|uniref:uncharacterized protein LOC121258125 n=1 Tax=Juglans microcarpa x Juglans regia TaxID=2249226 RepID=UPI001B7E915E|nr:uncharacterized protein LOC121258125 [Juglans microcarpa x Juglans regia]
MKKTFYSLRVFLELSWIGSCIFPASLLFGYFSFGESTIICIFQKLYFQIEHDVGMDSIKLKALIDLFDEIVEEPLFNQLRRKEQLGYVVQCSPRVTPCFWVLFRCSIFQVQPCLFAREN